MEPLGCGLCGWVDVFGFKNVWHLCGVADVAQQVEMEYQHWRSGVVNHLVFLIMEIELLLLNVLFSLVFVLINNF